MSSCVPSERSTAAPPPPCAAYVDTNLVGSGKVTKAAILGLAGGVWASSAGFTLSPDEQKAILAGYTHPDQVQANGIRLAGQKYFTLSVNDRSIYGKKAADGCIIVKTKQAVLVTVYVAPIQAPEATPVVEGLADYLISVGY
ncbi:Profilin-1B [Grifola frondosa]|uniref:Profilin n=1 Tax=Grifola frondosa TaxID=5627 RepID=A0A1C7MNJ6_GRIFR|nr:Profilin-1B [Grifola frondosa]